METRASSRRIDILQSLRGIFAIFIFLHHLDIFPAGGDAGVAFFLMLSGFVMTHGFAERVCGDTFSYGAYMRRRMARIYPLHLACLLAALLLLRGEVWSAGPVALSLNLVLMQSWVPLPEVYFSGNAVAWCLSDLLFFYCIFPSLTRLLARMSRMLIAVAAAAGMAVYVSVLMLTPEHYLTGIVYVNPLMRLPDFMIGIALWHLWKSTGMHMERKARMLSTLFEAGVWCLFAWWVMLYARVPESVGLASWWWPVSALLILVFLRRRKGLISRILSVRAAVKAGELSFSFYMVHQLVIRAMQHCFARMDVEPDIAVRIAVAFLLSAAATWAVHRYVEVPARRWLLRSV